MSTDPQTGAIVRAARRERNTGGRTCDCGNHGQVVADSEPPLCYGCSRGGPEAIEPDHPAGRANLPRVTIQILVNPHRHVTELRANLGLDSWPKADGDPLLACAHLLGGFASYVWLLAEWLRDVAIWLQANLSPTWHRGLPRFPFPI
jgi:hypothetical protein